MQFTPQQVLLALQMLQFFTAKVPQVVEAFEAGHAEELNWDALMPRRREDLEAEVDDHLKGA